MTRWRESTRSAPPADRRLRSARQLTNDAVWVPTVNERDVELVSTRRRNYQYTPIWGVLADQSWLR